MANPTQFQIKRLDDATLYRVLKAAEKAGNSSLEEARESGTLKGRSHTIKLAWNTLLPWQLTDNELQNAEAGQYVLGRASLSFTAKVPVGNQDKNDTVSFEFSRAEGNSLHDIIAIRSNNQNNAMDGEGEQAVQRAIHRSLSVVLQPVAPEDGGLIPTLTNLSQAFDTTYSRIASELSTAVRTVSQERADQINEFQEERQKLRKEVSKERDALLKTTRKTLDAERTELEAERLEIKDERAKLEISSHKDARRKQFNELQASLGESLSAPVIDKGLSAARWAVFIALLIAGTAAGYFAYLSFNVATWEAAIPSSAVDRFSTTLMLILRSVILTAASLVAFFGAAAWMRYFYNRDLQSQEEMRRFRNDMARASWVMEAALEIRKEHNEEIPPEWIAGVTEGLFTASKKESIQEGAQALAALMGLSAGANIGPNGLEVQLSRKGRKQIAEAAAES